MASCNDLLLVIDFQNVYLPDEEWACPSMPGAIANTKKLLASGKVEDVLFTQFLAAEHPVGTWQEYNRAYRGINEDARLCDIVSELKPFLQRYPLAVKSTYSSMKAEEVRKRAQKKDTLVLTGVVAECCILSTMMEAIDLGYQVIYLYDCVSGQGPAQEAAVRGIAESFAPMHTLVMSSSQYLERMNG